MPVERHRFLRSLSLTVADDLMHDSTRDPELFVREIDVLPFESKQFALAESRGYIEQDKDTFARFQRRQ